MDLATPINVLNTANRTYSMLAVQLCGPLERNVEVLKKTFDRASNVSVPRPEYESRFRRSALFYVSRKCPIIAVPPRNKNARARARANSSLTKEFSGTNWISWSMPPSRLIGAHAWSENFNRPAHIRHDVQIYCLQEQH
jgi:hypothetical protein